MQSSLHLLLLLQLLRMRLVVEVVVQATLAPCCHPSQQWVTPRRWLLLQVSVQVGPLQLLRQQWPQTWRWQCLALVQLQWR